MDVGQLAAAGVRRVLVLQPGDPLHLVGREEHVVVLYIYIERERDIDIYIYIHICAHVYVNRNHTIYNIDIMFNITERVQRKRREHPADALEPERLCYPGSPTGRAGKGIDGAQKCGAPEEKCPSLLSQAGGHPFK